MVVWLYTALGRGSVVCRKRHPGVNIAAGHRVSRPRFASLVVRRDVYTVVQRLYYYCDIVIFCVLCSAVLCFTVLCWAMSVYFAKLLCTGV